MLPGDFGFKKTRGGHTLREWSDGGVKISAERVSEDEWAVTARPAGRGSLRSRTLEAHGPRDADRRAAEMARDFASGDFDFTGGRR